MVWRVGRVRLSAWEEGGCGEGTGELGRSRGGEEQRMEMRAVQLLERGGRLSGREGRWDRGGGGSEGGEGVGGYGRWGDRRRAMGRVGILGGGGKGAGVVGEREGERWC